MKRFSCYQDLKEYACDNLNRIRRINKDKTQITVKYSKCSCAAGAEEVINVFKQLIEENGLENVILKFTGCIGMCSMEPIVEILSVDSDKPITYCNINGRMAKIIFLNHVIKGQAIYPWMLKHQEVTYNEHD